MPWVFITSLKTIQTRTLYDKLFSDDVSSFLFLRLMLLISEASRMKQYVAAHMDKSMFE